MDEMKDVNPFSLALSRVTLRGIGLTKEFKFVCPHCDQHLQVAEEFAGRQLQCPNCNLLMRVPPPPDRPAAGGTVERGRTCETFIPPAKPK